MSGRNRNPDERHCFGSVTKHHVQSKDRNGSDIPMIHSDRRAVPYDLTRDHIIHRE